jgi:hypothetical protein
MDKRFGIIFWGITGFALLFWAAFSIIKGGLFNFAAAGLLIAPFIFILFVSYRRYWHVLIPVFLVADQLQPEIYGLNKLTPIFVLLCAATATQILDRAFHSLKKKPERTWEDRASLIIALILTVRLVYDHPGFVALGMEEGGFISSFTYTMAAWFYFTVQRMAAGGTFTRKQLRLAAAAVFLIGTLVVIKSVGSGILITRFFGGPEFWMLCAMLISLLATSSSQQRRTLLFYLTGFVFLALGLISTFRSRVFFFMAEIFSVSMFMKRFRETLLIVGLGGVAGVVLMISVSGEVPAIMRRFLSLFMDTGQMYLEGTGGAYGWEDSFRSELYRLAWLQIQIHPFAGSGFGLNVSEAIGVLSGSGDTTLNLLAFAGSYHNSVVALAVKAGLPAAILFSVVSIAVPVRFMRSIFRTDTSDFRVWEMAVFAFWCANTGMMLMNGGPLQFFAGMILNGYMTGMMKNPAGAQMILKVKAAGKSADRAQKPVNRWARPKAG